MLHIEIEYKRGILFARLIGDINNNTINNLEVIDNMITKAGIKYLLLNFEKVSIISNNQIEFIIDKYKKLIGQDGKLLICGYYNNAKLKINIIDNDKIYLSTNELNAFNIINI